MLSKRRFASELIGWLLRWWSQASTMAYELFNTSRISNLKQRSDNSKRVHRKRACLPNGATLKGPVRAVSTQNIRTVCIFHNSTKPVCLHIQNAEIRSLWEKMLKNRQSTSSFFSFTFVCNIANYFSWSQNEPSGALPRPRGPRKLVVWTRKCSNAQKGNNEKWWENNKKFQVYYIWIEDCCFSTDFRVLKGGKDAEDS